MEKEFYVIANVYGEDGEINSLVVSTLVTLKEAKEIAGILTYSFKNIIIVQHYEEIGDGKM